MKSILLPAFVTASILLGLAGCQGNGKKGASNEGDLDTIPLLSQQEIDKVEKLAKQFRKQTEIAVAIVEGQKTRYYGVRVMKDSLAYVANHELVYEVGSISKVFTSTILANLVLDGKVELDDDIGSVGSSSLKNAESIQLVHLANHTSGLPRIAPATIKAMFSTPNDPYKDFGPEELKTYFTEELKLKSEPGETYAYSNLGAGTLGFLVSEVAQKSYSECLSQYIFEPMGMENSFGAVEDVTSRQVVGLNNYGMPVPHWHFDALSGAGSVISSAEDLSKFIQAHFVPTNRPLALTRMETFQVNEGLSVGLGWHISPKEGKTLHWHNGGTGGFRSCMVMDVANQKGVVVLSNVSHLNKLEQGIDDLCFSLMHAL